MSEDTTEGEGQLFGESSVDLTTTPVTKTEGEVEQIKGFSSENREKETTEEADHQRGSGEGGDSEILSVADDAGRDETVDEVQCDGGHVGSTITKDDHDGGKVDNDANQSMTSKGAEALTDETGSGENMEGSAVDPQPPEDDKQEVASGVRTQKEGKKKKKDKQTVIDNDEEVNVGDLSQLTEDSRNILFGRALVYERDSKKNCALKCYLACLSHLTPQSNFVLLPQCLRNIADLYYRKEEYEKAILFIQAEKLFYENALVDTNEIQQKIESLRQGAGNSDSSRSNEDAKIAADSLRADEYEHLAKLCVDKKQPQLALEYAGKATKLRQKIYGNDNPITRESLDFFATLYAEVGKQQYSDSITQLNDSEGSEGASVSPAVTPSMERSPSSILRQRRTGDDKEKKQVRFQEPEGGSSSTGSDSTREQEEFISHTLLWVLFAICFLLLCILGLWLLCSMSDTLACQWVKGELHYFYMRIKYYYYQYASTKKIKYA
ncbi:uncharacterized protein LOC124145044 [Haliotis rufescens]|uniref:uncharacterized protein LOC124145044 n=1 Tax=Haliotis rufescens TaxID=6454 RepID=UPI00201F23CD|nr:uncharacterized protein LOC124145044 [Haliotis rufescens]XP_046370663.2 uncharacterized protein LOC124145044 [Haliotis rufescens]